MGNQVVFNIAEIRNDVIYGYIMQRTVLKFVGFVYAFSTRKFLSQPENQGKGQFKISEATALKNAFISKIFVVGCENFRLHIYLELQNNGFRLTKAGAPYIVPKKKTLIHQCECQLPGWARGRSSDLQMKTFRVQTL